ncbi:uncharacterized protein LOC112576266 [Pomacea canaliculata]|uniref:uncharacterized protein LOC112576266 n=1 Tax=Pomacea canaliculata TaxID=400727 RepID=UPI000D725906|nr:uncharacterized protein LOC112576266 [Pomacea canaliculata]
MAEQNERECAVCTNDFTTPKILPCGHLLCRECVISWMDSKADAGCPLCRCPIVEQSDGSSSDTVDALPTDFVMEALVESARVLSKDHLCCVCEDVRADFICMQCQDMLCSACTKAHRKLSMSRSHDVESVSTVTPERLAASRPALCADHGDKHAELFCRSHGLPVCLACKSNIHKVCPEVNFLDDEIQSAQNLLKDLTKSLVEAEQKLEQAIGQVTSRLQEVDVSEQEDMAQVDKTCDRLQKLVEDFRKNLKEKTRTSHLKIRNSLRDVKTDLSNRLGKVTSHKHIVTRAVAVSPRPALIHMTQALTDRVNSLDLNANLEGEVWEKPLSSAEYCQEVAGRIEKDLMMLAPQTTKTQNVTPTMQHTSFPQRFSRPDQVQPRTTSLSDSSFKKWYAANKMPVSRWGMMLNDSRKKRGRRFQFGAKRPFLVFHENCCSNIRLTNCNTGAEKINPTNTFNDGMVVSREAMETNYLYEVIVDAVSSKDNRVFVGVTSIPPAWLNMTKYSGHLYDVMIYPRVVYQEGEYVSNTLGQCLKKLQVGSRVGVMVDSSNGLHLYVNGQDKGIVSNFVKQPCFALFGIWYKVTQVTACCRLMRR